MTHASLFSGIGGLTSYSTGVSSNHGKQVHCTENRHTEGNTIVRVWHDADRSCERTLHIPESHSRSSEESWIQVSGCGEEKSGGESQSHVEGEQCGVSSNALPCRDHKGDAKKVCYVRHRRIGQVRVGEPNGELRTSDGLRSTVCSMPSEARQSTTPRPMRHASLFSGVGGFDLAASWMGWTNVFQVEIDPFCQKVLEKNFPNTKRFLDIKRLKTDNDGNLIYCDCGEQKEPKIRSGKRNVRKGIINSGNSPILCYNPPSDAQNTEAQGGEISQQTSIPAGEPFLQRNESPRPYSKCSGICNQKGDCDKKNPLRKMRGFRDIQEQKDENPSSSPELQQTIGCNVALPEVSSSMAQGEQTNSDKKISHATINPVSGTCQQQHAIVARRGEIDILSGGFP